MKWLDFFLVAVATLAGVIASMVPASGQVDKGAGPGLRKQNAPRLP